MINRFLLMANLIFLLLLSAWVLPGWTQAIFGTVPQYNPQIEAHWKERIRHNPRDSKAYFYLGKYYELARRTAESAECFQQATVLDPADARAFLDLGRAYRDLRRDQEAAVALQRAVTLKSNYAEAYHYLGLVKIRLGKLDEAADAFIKSYTYDPGWAETYYDHSPYGVHFELGSKPVVLKLIERIYPVNQRLARIMYNQWARNGSAMNNYWETVAGKNLPADKGYQRPVEPGYQKPGEVGYQEQPPAGYYRQAN